MIGTQAAYDFGFSAATVYCQLPVPRSISAFVPESKNRTHRPVTHKRDLTLMAQAGRPWPLVL